jgi:hypothetical protein
MALDLAAILALTATAALLPLASRLHNDHFDRIARARQIAAYGEVPFRDFPDPGYFLTLYASALGQRIFGFNLLGEILLNLAGISAGLAMAYLVASRVTGSRLTAFIATTLALLAAPRLYDYDKVLFYPLGVALCWLYARRPVRGRLALLAIGTALAGLFRYDNGICVASAAIVTIAAVHWRRWRDLGRSLVAYASVAALALAPAVLFVALHGGITEAVTQMMTYALREGPRTRIFRPARFVIDAQAPPENASAWLYYLLMVLPFVSVVLVYARKHREACRSSDPSAGRTVLAAATLLVLVHVFVLRDPIDAHLGSVAIAAAVPAAWVFAGPPGGGRLRRAAGMRIASGTTLIAVTVLGLGVIGPWRSLLERGRVLSEPSLFLTRVRSFARDVRQSPPPLERLPFPEMAELVRYVRQCATSEDRLMASWFAPEIYYFSGRAFAGGMAVYFGGHWSELEYQRRTLARLNAEMPPIVIVQGRTSGPFREGYPLVDQFVWSRYRLAATVDFDDPGSRGYQVFVDRDRPQTGVYGRWALPCFGPPA